MSRRFTDLQLQFAWLRGGVESARTKRQVQEQVLKGREVVRNAAEGSNKKAARAAQRALGVLARKQLGLLNGVVSSS